MRVSVGVRSSPPNVSGPPKPASSMSTIRTFGAPSGAFGPGDHRPVANGRVHGAPCHPAEGTVGDRKDGPVLAELAHRLRERILQGGGPLLVRPDHRACERPRQDELDAERLVVLEHGENGGGAGLERLADLVVEAGLQLVLREVSGDPARRGPHDGRRQQRGSGQAHEEADRAAVAQPLAAEVVAGLLDDDVVVLVVADQDRALDSDLLRLHGCDEIVELLRRRIDIRVCGNQDVGQLVSHEFVSRKRCDRLCRPSFEPMVGGWQGPPAPADRAVPNYSRVDPRGHRPRRIDAERRERLGDASEDLARQGSGR